MTESSAEDNRITYPEIISYFTDSLNKAILSVYNYKKTAEAIGERISEESNFLKGHRQSSL